MTANIPERTGLNLEEIHFSISNFTPPFVEVLVANLEAYRDNTTAQAHLNIQVIADNIDEAVNISHIYAEYIAKQLFFHIELYIDHFKISEICDSERLYKTSYPIFLGKLIVSRHLNSEEVLSLKYFLESKYNPYITAYYVAACQQDLLAQFILLYSLAALVCGLSTGQKMGLRG